MKKICVTSVVSLLIAFVLVFAGCEQPVTAGLNNGGSVAVEETGAAVEGETGDVLSLLKWILVTMMSLFPLR